MNHSCNRKLVGLLPLVLILTGCNAGVFNQHTAEETVTKNLKVGSAPEVIVETFNGNIDVATVEQGEVEAIVTKKASAGSQEAAEDALDEIEVTITQEGDTVHITARSAVERYTGNRGATVDVHVPRGTKLELRSKNGTIKSTGTTGDVFAESSNGGIQLKGGRGKLHLATSNGRIAVEQAKGRLELRTTNGGIEVQSDAAEVDAKTSNGSIQFKGKLAEGVQRFETSNGGIALHLPADASFRVDAKTSNGHIRSDFSVQGANPKEKHSLHGTVGERPKTTLDLHTSNGGIQIHRVN